MSMRDYAVDDYGLLMTKKMLKAVASKATEDYSDEEYDNYEMDFNYELYELGIIETISDFTGEAMKIDADGSDNWYNGECFNGECVYYVPVSKYPNIFTAAYKDMDEIANEFKEKLGKYLPNDFDYKLYIRHIVGTYFG